MNFQYTTAIGFAHGVLYRDLTIAAWAKRTGRMSKSGSYGYREEDCPYDIPTNAERGRAEVIRFTANPLKHGESYTAYLVSAKPEHWDMAKALGCEHHRGVITTWNGDVLAVVTRITSHNAVCFGRDAGMKGSFWAKGIDGRTYYGRHNGRGMYCRMRLAKWVDEYDIQQQTSEDWETVHCEPTLSRAREQIAGYRDNSHGTYRIKRTKVRQE